MPRLAPTAASSTARQGPALHSRAVTASKLEVAARSAIRSPAMISSPCSPSTWLSAVLAAGMPSSPIGLLVIWIFMALSSPMTCHLRKVDQLDGLINLDYTNQYEKLLRPLSFSTRGVRRARDLAGHALRLCQPRPDPLRAVAGLAQSPLPRRGRTGTEGAPRAVTGAEGFSQL